MSDIENDDLNVFTYSEDLNNAEAPKPLPGGKYPFEVRKADIVDSKSKPGKKNLKLELYIAPEEYPATYLDGNPDGLTLTAFRALNDTARGRYQMKKFNQALGVKNTAKIDPTEYLGATGMVVIEEQMGQDGLPQENIKSIEAKS